MTWPTGKYAVIYADPPWNYRVRSAKGEGRSATRHYSTMKLPDIKALPVADLAATNCHLFMWVTGPNLRQGFEVLDAWGFKYSSVAFTWIKLTRKGQPLLFHEDAFFVGMGYTTRKNAEFCLLGRRGRPQRLSKKIRELIISPIREHSRKPDQAIERIEQYAAGPYLELFARTTRPGWKAWGNETEKFGAVA